ncbi:MAG: universal stress protein [bacterium]|jgi:nucleotide-binding universal stress UspA family protein|nr:universal stress protein [Betaproteobacteria bacterium]
MYRKILVAIDDSETSARGLDEAIKLAKGDTAQLCILHVIEPTALAMYPEAAAYADDLFDMLREAGKEVLQKAVARAAKRGLQARSALIENRGFPIAELIVEYAGRWKADVIVLGTHGRRGFSHLLMGSDAESVVRSSPIPVLLVRSPDGAKPGTKPRRPASKGQKAARPAARG